jgi:hypothetical protein
MTAVGFAGDGEALGHGVVKRREGLPVRTPDDEVLRQAAERDCLLITCNRDDFLAVVLANGAPRARVSTMSGR